MATAASLDVDVDLLSARAREEAFMRRALAAAEEAGGRGEVPMCAGALVNARIRRLYFGCDDPKAGAVRTLYTLLDDRRLNHRVEVIPGLLAAEGSALLRGFFSRLRRE